MAVFILIGETSFEARAGDVDTREEKETGLSKRRRKGKWGENCFVCFDDHESVQYTNDPPRWEIEAWCCSMTLAESHYGNLARGQPVWICLYVLQEV